MDCRFVKMNPSGNTTVLILDPVPRERYKEISQKVMADTALCAEQVGFLEPSENTDAIARLQMMGGEFCGNASRCFAAWIALGGFYGGRPSGFKEEQKIIPIEVSGHAGVLSARITNLGRKNACIASVEMPLPLSVRHNKNDLLGDHSIVIYEGILHVILWDQAAGAQYVDIVRKYLDGEGLDHSCFGIMFFDSVTKEMVPVVYVGEVDSLVWENSCGSGTVAVASAMADREKKSIETIRISQPGGDLYADVLWHDGIKTAYLHGDVAITAAGTVFID